MRSGWLRAAQAAAGALVLGLAGRSLGRNWDALQAQPLVWRVEPGYLILSALVVWLMYAALIEAWRVMLRGWGEQLDGWTAARIWTVSSLGKYVPGKVWAVAGMAMLSQRAGVAPWAATGSAVILQALAIGTGAAVAAVTGVPALEAARPGTRGALVALAFASAAGLAVLFYRPVLRRLVRLASPRAADATPAPRRAILFGIGANVLAWAGYGVSLWLLARGLVPAAGLRLSVAISAFAASYLAGFLALLAPGGIGVRESVFILLLQGPLGIANATALAVASRILLTITELGAAVPFLAFPRRSARVAT